MTLHQLTIDPSTVHPSLPVIDAEDTVYSPALSNRIGFRPGAGPEITCAPGWITYRRTWPRYRPIFPANISKRYSSASTNTTLRNYTWYPRSSHIAGLSELAGLPAQAQASETEGAAAGPHSSGGRVSHACAPPISPVGDGGLEPGLTGLGPAQGHAASRAGQKNHRKTGRPAPREDKGRKKDDGR
jgi:hypothetical protein